MAGISSRHHCWSSSNFFAGLSCFPTWEMGDCAESGRGMGPGSGGREKPAHAQKNRVIPVSHCYGYVKPSAADSLRAILTAAICLTIAYYRCLIAEHSSRCLGYGLVVNQVLVILMDRDRQHVNTYTHTYTHTKAGGSKVERCCCSTLGRPLC